MYNEQESVAAVKLLCEEFRKYNHIDPALYEKFNVKRGLRNSDGTGVMAGLTQICNVHGYIVSEGEFTPIPGQLYYRGYDVVDIVKNAQEEQRFGFEEVIYLLMFGTMPNKSQLEKFMETISAFMHLPDNFFDDMILKAPSPNIMNKLARAILALYSYDDDADNTSLESEINRALHTIAQMTNIMVKAYQVRLRYYENKTMFLHPLKYGLSIAEEILSLLRVDREYTKDEALLLDMCLILHAEHGGGNNSTFACRVLSSSGTDAYAAYAAAIGSLKGPKHGGANIKVLEMLMDIEKNVADIKDKGQVADYLKKIIKKEANDKTGLIYGMGHAVYTLSDPRAVLLKAKLETMVAGTEFEDEFNLIKTIEEITPQIFMDEKWNPKPICANVDLYSGLVYKMLKIPMELFTPIFATSRIAGWGAHRIEELTTGNRIIRPAYKPVVKAKTYLGIDKR